MLPSVSWIVTDSGLAVFQGICTVYIYVCVCIHIYIYTWNDASRLAWRHVRSESCHHVHSEQSLILVFHSQKRSRLAQQARLVDYIMSCCNPRVPVRITQSKVFLSYRLRAAKRKYTALPLSSQQIQRLVLVPRPVEDC